MLGQEAAGTPGSSGGVSGVAQGTTCPGLCLCSHSATSVVQLLLPEPGIVLWLPSLFVFFLVGSVVLHL